jgi:hypothetical protein
MMTLIAAAVLAVQPAPAPANPPSHHEQMEHSGTMGHMGSMSEKEMADCHKCCEEMMSKMHHGHAQHKGHAG